MPTDIEKRLVFAIGPVQGDPHPMLIIGIPKGCWEHMKDGKTSHLDLSSIGIPVKLMMFGADSHDACMKMIQQCAAQQNIAILDKRRDDFSMKDKDGKTLSDS